METRAWMQTAAAFGHRGVVDTILRLLETERITRRKAVELVEAWYRLSLGQSVDDADLRAPWETVTWGDTKEMVCPRCAGCGKVANTPEGEPWSHWTDLPLNSAGAVIVGLVRPVTCPACGGRGRVSSQEDQ